MASGLDMNVCGWVIWGGQAMYTVIQAVHSLLYIVAKCHFSVCHMKDLINIDKMWGVCYSLMWDTVYMKCVSDGYILQCKLIVGVSNTTTTTL